MWYRVKAGAQRLAVPVSLLLLAGCAVGPDYKKPAAPEIHDYTAQPLAPTTATAVPGGEAQRFALDSDIAGEWWSLFHSKPLNALIEQALAANPDLKAAQAALSVSRENVLAQRGVFLPAVSAGFTATRQLQPGTLAPVPSSNAFQYNLFTPQLSVSYSPDVFGLNRRGAESLEAQQQAVRFQMIAAYNTLTANVVVTAIQLASLEGQVEATREIIAADARLVEILEYQQTKGYASGLDVAAQKSQLAQANAQLPPLLKQRAQLQDLMAALTGHFPNQAPPEKFDLASLQLPQQVPLSLPSKLVEQRPDVLQAEANQHAASAQIGVAVANRLPNFELTGNIGNTALTLGELFTPGTGFWSLGAAVTQPIFQGGTLLHQERAARASYDQASQQYRSTVLAAFQNVADTLAALQQDAEGLKAAAAAADAAKTTLDLAQRQYQDGYAGYPALLNAEQSYQQSRIALIEAEASRFADTAALFQALGGGWWNRTELAGDEHGK
ncbi:MAG: efflux transporter outer membrane subunit [Rhizomicrobium sp.]|nr:efflux transporter outer membrane subunit [Rhizomicrobium sp.]